MDKSEFGKTTLPDLQLRQAAETQLSNVYLRDLAVRPAEILLHELQVHQVELEMQNETLRQAQIDLEESRDRYVDLYEFTPLGYLTLTSDGLISEINLTGARLLGVERKRLLQKCFTTFVIPEDRDHWITQYLSVTKQGGQVGLELALQRSDGTVFHAQLNMAVHPADAEKRAIRITLTDISQRVAMEKGLAVASKRLNELSRCLVEAQKETEQRLARELHDRTSANLAAIRINLEIISAKFSQEDFPEIAECLADTRALIEDTNAGIREISTDLRCPLLENEGLTIALEAYAHRFSKRTGIPVQVNCTNGETRVRPALEFLLFRIIQEALTNSLKHARAESLTVTMDLTLGSIALTVADDGVGFDLDRVETGLTKFGTGLCNMREMAVLAGGELFIHSHPDEGTQIEVRIPDVLETAARREIARRVADPDAESAYRDS